MSTEEKGLLEHIPADVIEGAKITPDKKEPPPTTKREWQKLVDFFEAFPGAERMIKILKAIFGFAGIRGIICLLLGFASALIVFNLGRMPNFLILEKYRSSPVKTSQPAEVRTKPTDIGVHLGGSVEWVKPHVRWLEQEGDNLKAKKVIKGYMANALESAELSATTEFSWMLQSSPGFEMNGFAFRLHNSGSSKFFEQLNAIKKAPDLLIVEVPKCEKGDRLVAVLRVSWKQDLKTSDILATFHSSAK